jgi:site-specific recombinase XerC
LECDERPPVEAEGAAWGRSALARRACGLDVPRAWTDPVTGERRSQEFDTVDDALDYKAYLRLARRRGALDELSRGRVVLSEFVEDDWWPNHAGRRLSRHTLNAYSQVWNRYLLPRVGRLELGELTTPTMQTLREALEADGLGPATVRKSLAVLQSICAHALRKGELTINPVSAVRKPAAKRAVVIDPFSVEEVEALIGALRDRASHPSQWMLAELIAYSGARPQDALALSYGRIGTRRIVYAEKNIDGRIVGGSKTGQDRARSVTLLASLRKDLLAFRLAAGNPPDDALAGEGQAVAAARLQELAAQRGPVRALQASGEHLRGGGDRHRQIGRDALLPPPHLRQPPPRRAAPLAAGDRRGDGPHRRGPRAHLCARDRRVPRPRPDRPRCSHQQGEG